MNHYFTNSEIKSNLKEFKLEIDDKSFIFATDNGVFSKKGLDFGSRLLIETLIKENLSGNLLEVGCGYGIIGIILSKEFNLDVDMVDVNDRAIHLTQMNIKKNKSSSNVFHSDCYSEVSKKYDYIITNPPIRAGKKVVYDILFNAKDYLNKSGVLYFVMRKEQGALSTIKDLNKVCEAEVLIKHKGYLVIKAKFV
ncbi:MAG TPA: methyltransferase [Bacilli bacterium]|nr:methyltransferase [Bacilli bacterium]